MPPWQASSIIGTATLTKTVSIFAGGVINLYLFGALTVQLYVYYASFPTDSRLYKAVVYVVFVLEAVNIILGTYDLGRMFIHRRYHPFLSYWAAPLCGATTVLLTQAIFAYRIHIITKSKRASGAIIVAIIIQFIITLITVPLASDFVGVTAWVSISWFIDTLIAGIMIWLLKRSRVLCSRLKRRITRLVYIIMGTNTLTAALNLFTILSFLISPQATLGPLIVLSKLYANSMMVLLNDRVSARQDTSSMTTLQFDIVIDVDSRPHVVTWGEGRAKRRSSV